MEEGIMIKSAAVNIDGKIFTGKSHELIFREIRKTDQTVSKRATAAIYGFVTDTGEFMTRSEAADHAFLCGQVQKYKPVLLSEDIK
jgi:hypothetical protein